MASREPFLLRTDPAVLQALRRWARDELRSVNAQLEFVVRRALRDAGRLPDPAVARRRDAEAAGDAEADGGDAGG